MCKMSATFHRHDDDDNDEFDSLFDDQQFLDPELEESLAQAEATYTASQAARPPVASAVPSSQSLFRLHAQPSHGPNRKGAFVPSAPKKQRIDPGPSNLSRLAGPTRPSLKRELEADQVIVRNPREEEFADNDDEQWWAANNALDQVEEEAIRMSQQLSASQPHAATSDSDSGAARHAESHRLVAPLRRSTAALSKPPDPERRSVPPSNAAIRDNAGNDELAELRAEVEKLRSAQRAQDEMVEKLKQEAYRKSGEVAVVRQNLTKLNQENSKLREREVMREQEHRAALDRLQKDQERRLERLETETAFRRVEQDTSRRIWPSSVARLPPVGLRELDRRQESQVRAGLTTPTKANKFGIRGGSGSSGHRQRYADSTADRIEPGTPTRSATKPASNFPRPPTATTSASKSKAFRGLQNSFADFAPVQEKARQRRPSVIKPTLQPAEWDTGQPLAGGPPDHDDITMTDGDPLVPSAKQMPSVGPHKHDSGHRDPMRANQQELDYLTAVSEILNRRVTVVSLLLSHTSAKAAAPATYPANRFNPTASLAHTRTINAASDTPSSTSTTTLCRLISADLVSDCPKLLLFRYRQAVESLLITLGKAKVMEPEEREDAFRLLSAEDNDHSVEELDFASATMHLSHDIASSLMVMAGVLLRLCQTDLLVDTLRLISCLVSTLPRFWLDLECLKTSHDAKSDEINFLGSDDPTSQAQLDKYTTPIHLREILAQCIDECRPPSTEKESDASPRPELSRPNGKDGAIHGRYAHQGDEEEAQKLGLGSWTLSSEAREDLLDAVVQVLEAMSQCPDATASSSHHPLRLLQRPGVLHKLLHPDRSSYVIFNVVRMLSSAVSNAPLIHECLASKADNHGTHSNAPRASARFPVLELLVKHLVDRRFDLPESEWHPLHCGIITFLTQATLRSADTLIVLADSAALLAALIRCLSLDSDFVWLNSRPTFMLPPRLPTFRPGAAKSSASVGAPVRSVPDPSGANLVQATERIAMDTRLLNLLYNYPLPLTANHAHRFEPVSSELQGRMGSISLAAKLDQPETYSMLNGIRQSFVVALSRIAFCSEPDWIAPERKMLASLLPDLRQQEAQSRKHMDNDNGEQNDNWEDQGEESVVEEVEEMIRGLDRVSMLLEAIADVAGDLADIVLSPEEIDSVYDLLASGEDEDVEDEDAMDVDREELHRREQDLPASAPAHQPRPEAMEAGSDTESEPEVEVGNPMAESRKAVPRSSKSVSPAKRPARKGSGDEDIDVIEIDDSD